MEQSRGPTQSARPPLTDDERETQKLSATEALKHWARTFMEASTERRPAYSWGVVLLVVVFISVLVFAAIDRGVRFDDGSAAQNTAQRGAGTPGPSKGATPTQSKRRWFIQQQGGYNMGFNIQLDADGSSGSASWPDDKNVTGTFTLEGDKLEVTLNRPMPAVYNSRDQFVLHMTVQPDGSLTGTVEYDAYMNDAKGKTEHVRHVTPAVGERR